MKDYIFLFAGAVFLLLIRMNKAKAKPGFTYAYFITKNIPSVLLNLVGGFIIIYAGYTLKILDEATRNLFCAFLGMTGATVLQGIFDMFDKDKKTVVGINKDNK